MTLQLLSTSIFDLMRTGGVQQGRRHRYNTRLAAQFDDTESEDEERRGLAPSAVFHFSSGDPEQPGQAFHG